MKLLICFAVLPFLAHTQNANPAVLNIHQNKGINWSNEKLTWDQIKSKAKRENKIIFIDAYTTWCTPCKMMEDHVFSSDSVGIFFNAKILSIRLQMDTTENDNSVVKSRFPIAHKINREYQILAYPTFLFISGDGVLLQRGEGFMNVPQFLSFASEATNPGRAYKNENDIYLKGIAQYRKGVKDYKQMPFLITMAQKRLQYGVRDSILNDYYNHKLINDKLFLHKSDNLELLASNLTSRSPFLHLFYPKGNKVNMIVKKRDFARFAVQNMIENEYIQPFINSTFSEITYKEAQAGREPNWQIIHEKVARDYGVKYAATAVRSAKHHFYLASGKASLDASNLKEQLKNNDLDSTDVMTDWLLNSASWNLYLTSNDKEELSKALEWVKTAVRRRPDMYHYMDTYAGLLYKTALLFGTNKTHEAMDMQQRAIEKAVDRYALPAEVDELRKRLDQMKKGEITWTNQE